MHARLVRSSVKDAGVSEEPRAALDPASQALLDSQTGPHAAVLLTTLPVCPELRLATRTPPPPIAAPPAPHRSPLPLWSAPRRVRGPPRRLPAVWPPPHARRAPGTRCGPGLPGGWRHCRGPRACSRPYNVVVGTLDDRRIEVIANGLPMWSGAQLPVDTTLVSPLTAAARPRGRPGAALAAARRAKERAYPELTRATRCRLVVLGLEVGGRWSSEAATFVRLLARAKARSYPPPSRPFVGDGVGAGSSPSRPSAPSRLRS